MSFRHHYEKDKGGEKLSAFGSSLEFASSWGNNYNFGSELFIPFSDTGNDNDRYVL
jgi:hypothetical protein